MPDPWHPEISLPDENTGYIAQTLRRHDLVWLAPSTPMQHLRVNDAELAAVEYWFKQTRPFVVGRQHATMEDVRLGFTLPDIRTRHRIEIFAPASAIQHVSVPPALVEMIAYAPQDWQALLRATVQSLGSVGLSARCYGSLVTQAISGEQCVRPQSDIDLLIECRTRTDIEHSLTVLLQHGSGTPRLDGEIRLPNGWAVAWRELALAMSKNTQQVMIKTNDDVRMVSLLAFLNASDLHRTTQEKKEDHAATLPA